MILCSSGVLWEADKPHTESILELGPHLPVDGLEVLVLRTMVGTLGAAAETLRATSMTFPVVHAPKPAGALLPGDEGVQQLTESARFARAIGAELIVLHLWDMPESDSDFDARLDAAVVAADIGQAEGVDVAIETIPCLAATPLANIERVLEHESRLFVALDTEFLAYHGEVERALSTSALWDANLVRHIHLKDFEGDLFDEIGRRRYKALGEGAIDFHAFFAALDGHGFDGTVSLESAHAAPDGTPDITEISRSLSRISKSPWRFT